MRLKVNLHAHSSESHDASSTPREVVEHFKRKGFDVISITDHNRVTKPPDVPGITVLKGVEWSIGDSMQHLLEYPDYDLRILPHPSMGGYVGKRLHDTIREYGVHGLELYNRGVQTTLQSDIPESVFAVSQSDFHVPGDENGGYFYLKAPSRAEEHVVQALKSPTAQGRIYNVRSTNPVDVPAIAIAGGLNVLGFGDRRDDSNVSWGSRARGLQQLFQKHTSSTSKPAPGPTTRGEATTGESTGATAGDEGKNQSGAASIFPI